jgi:hypothetical protein
MSFVYATPMTGPLQVHMWDPRTHRASLGFGLDLHWGVFDSPLRLPLPIKHRLGEQFRVAVRKASRHFTASRNDEDTVTGTLIAVLRDTVRGRLDGFRWETTANKVIGRGAGAGEHRFGADFAIELAATVHGVPRLKTLLVQAKTEWRGADPYLKRQAPQLARLPGDGLVVDYRAEGYRAVRASTAAGAGGNARFVPQKLFRGLGEVLAGDFVSCRVGSTKVVYVVVLDELLISEGGSVSMVRRIPFTAGHIVRTTVTDS